MLHFHTKNSNLGMIWRAMGSKTILWATVITYIHVPRCYSLVSKNFDWLVHLYVLKTIFLHHFKFKALGNLSKTVM
jgi:hypothetical protein